MVFDVRNYVKPYTSTSKTICITMLHNQMGIIRMM